MAKNAVQSTPDTPKRRRKRMMSDAEVIKSSSVSTSTPTATSSIITRPVCALFGRLWSEGIHVVTGLRSNMKQRLMPLYDKIMLRKRSIIETVNYILKNVVLLVHTAPQRAQLSDKPVRGNGAYCFFQSKPAVNFDYEVTNSDGRLTIWQ